MNARLAPLFAAGLLCRAGVAHAADPWGRPAHLRAVQAPPARLGDLHRDRRPVRLWWDRPDSLAVATGAAADVGVDCALAEVQVERGGRWRTVDRAAPPGWISRPVPVGTRFRVRLPRSDGRGEGACPATAGRFSAPVTALPVTSPSDLARLWAGEGALLGERVGQVAADLSSGRVWAATLGGGAADVDPATLRARPWTRFEGLPDDRVVDVDVRGDRVLLGTAEGALLLVDEGEGPQVVRLWSESLPSPWVQAVALGQEHDVAWLGTYRGLARAEGTQVTELLSPWSVFSLTADGRGGVWAGYDGLQHLSADGDEVSATLLSTDAHVYGLAEQANGLVLATLEEGLVHLDPAADTPPEGDGRAAYGVAATREGLWVARGPSGLEIPGGGRLGHEHGLPSSTAWSVADGGAGVWVGTRRGLARVLPPAAGSATPRVAAAPVTAWPADRDTTALLLRDRGLWLAGPDGVTRLGRPHRAADDLVVAAPQPVVALLDDDHGGAWAIGPTAVHLDRHGDLSVVELPAPPTAATRGRGGLWLAMSDLLWWLPDGSRRPVAVQPLRDATVLETAGPSLWAISSDRVLRAAPGVSRPFLQTHPALSLAVDPTDPTRVWVGTEDGLELLRASGPDEGEVVDLLAELDRGVAVPAVAADGHGGAWFAAVDGTVGRLLADGELRLVTLPGADPPVPRGLVVDDDGDAAWLLSDRGLWRARLPAGVGVRVNAPGVAPGAGP